VVEQAGSDTCRKLVGHLAATSYVLITIRGQVKAISSTKGSFEHPS
jgi:hypothetical protein